MSDIDPKKWTDSIHDLWAGESFFLLAIGVAALLAGVVAFFLKNTQVASWLFIAAVFFLIVGFFKRYHEQNVRTLVFIPDEIRSFWHHAPQPDGRKLTQFGFRGYVTNVTSKPLQLGKIKLISPKSKQQHQEFIFTVHDNRVDASHVPLLPSVRTVFDSAFFVDGFFGTSGKPLKVVVSVCDHLGHWHKIKFKKLRDPLDRTKNKKS
jgi:hypothetical protein